MQKEVFLLDDGPELVLAWGVPGPVGGHTRLADTSGNKPGGATALSPDGLSEHRASGAQAKQPASCDKNRGIIKTTCAGL